MKLQGISSTAVAVLCTFASQHICAEELFAATCCSDFDAECYTMSNNRSNNHACNQDSSVVACGSECDSNPTSEACKACCVTYPLHEVPWVCPQQFVTCLQDEYGIGNYSDYHSQNAFSCSDGQGDASFKFDLEFVDSAGQCLSLCESTGVPGCCQFQEYWNLEEHTITTSACQFRSSNGATFAELKNANGTEPIPIPRRLLMETGKTFHRAVRCEKATPGTDAPGTVFPSTDQPATPGTDGPTVPGSDGGAAQTSVSVAVMLAVIAVVHVR